MKNFGKPKLDSFRLIIPKKNVTQIDVRITEDFHRYYPDLDVVDEEIEEAKPLTNKFKGISSRYYIKEYRQGDKSLQCVVIQVNAKMLQEQYFEGITKKTIEKAYDYIIGEGLIYVDYRSFLNSLITDIDICIDYSLSPALAVDVCKQLEELTFYKHYVNVFKPNASTQRAGITWNNRAKAKPAKPFVKMYHKTLELLSKSIEFRDSFLQDININNIFRLEVTLKNAKDKDRHKIKDSKTLKDFLDIPESKLTEICKSAIPKYLEMTNKPKSPKGLSPTDEYIFNIIDFAIKKGCGTNEILSFADTIQDKSSKSRTKTRIKKLLTLSKKQDVLEHNTEVHNFIKKVLPDKR